MPIYFWKVWNLASYKIWHFSRPTFFKERKNEKACTGRKELPVHFVAYYGDYQMMVLVLSFEEFNCKSKEKKTQGHSLSGLIIIVFKDIVK